LHRCYSAFFVDHYVLCGVGRGNAERGRPVGWTHRIMGDGMVQKLDCGFPTILVVAPLTRRFVASITRS